MSVNISYFAGAGAQFFDDNGSPLVGGLLYVYAAGTTTPVATYTEISGTTNNTNPIILNAGGRTPAQIWLVGGALYKFVLKTSAGVTVGTYDNIPAVDDPTTFNNFLSITGTNTIVGTITPAITAYVAGATYSFTVANTNTGAVTINISGLGAKNIVANGSTALVAGQLVQGTLVSIEYDGVNSFQLMTASGAQNNVVSVNGGQLAGLRNRIINGAMKIDQRNSGASQTISSTTPPVLAYSVDRWYVAGAGSGTITGQQITSGAENRYRFTGGAGCVGAIFAQRIEAANCMDMAGKTATVSVKLSSSTLTSVNWFAYYANSTNTFGSIGAPAKTLISNGTFTISSTEATYSTQISIPSAATTGIEIYFSSGSFSSGTLTFGDVQFEISVVPSVFEQRPYGMELALCQRYYEIGFLRLDGYGAAAGTIGQTGFYKATKRATPVVSYSGTTYTNASAISTDASSDASAFSAKATITATAAASFATSWASAIEL